MHILFLSTWFPYPPNNGSKIRAYYLVRALACAHQVTLVAFQPDREGRDHSALAPHCNIDVYPAPSNPYRYVDLPEVLKFASPIPVMCWPDPVMERTVAQVAGVRRWDAVIAYEPPAARYAFLVPSAPRILEIDTALSYQMYERHRRQAGSVGRLRTWISWQKAHRYEARFFRRFEACTVAAAAELDYLAGMLKNTGSLAQLIPNGVDCQYNRPNVAQPVPNRLIFSGSLTYSANYDAMKFFLRESYPLIRQQVPDVSLTITGSSSGVTLSGLQLDDSVCLSGYVEDMRPLVAGASVCVVPLRQGGGTRIKILEAMALGTPVVATAKGAEGLDVVDGIHILLADDPTALADRTVQVLRDPALRHRLATNARRWVEQHHDWAQIGKRFVDLVETVAQGQRRKGASS